MSETNNVFGFEQTGNILIVTPSRRLMHIRDAELRDAYNDAYRALTQDDVTHLLFDFDGVLHFSSTFVGVMIRLAKKARLDGGQAVLCNLNEQMLEMLKTLMVLENTKTDFFWLPFGSRQEAIRSLRKPVDPSSKSSGRLRKLTRRKTS